MDDTQFERLLQEHRRALLAYAYACSRDLNRAEDIVQEALLIAFQKRQQYFAEADFGAWLISIARNVWFRERERLSRALPTDSVFDRYASIVFDPALYADEKWEREKQALAGCLGKLSETDRGIIRAHFQENRKYSDIAQAARRTLSWVKARMARARVALLKCIRRSMQAQEGSPA